MRSKIKNTTQNSVIHTIQISEIGICCEDSVLGAAALHGHAGLLIFSNLLLEEVSLPLQERIYEIVRDAVDIECEFLTEALPVRLIGLLAGPG